MLATALRERTVGLLAPELDPGKPMPYSLDYFALRFALAPADTLTLSDAQHPTSHLT